LCAPCMSSAHLLKASEKVQKYKFNLHYQAFGRCIFPEGESPLRAGVTLRTVSKWQAGCR
jgi:hypothetical protein